jgi:signal recognition particle GTPase
MFENLSDRLQDVVHKIKGYGKITEENISEMMREIRLSLLEADVNYKVIKEFSTRKEANEFEIFLHNKFDVKNHPKFINKANQTSSKFDTTGKSFNTNKLTVLDIRDGKTKQVSELHRPKGWCF